MKKSIDRSIILFLNHTLLTRKVLMSCRKLILKKLWEINELNHHVAVVYLTLRNMKKFKFKFLL